MSEEKLIQEHLSEEWKSMGYRLHCSTEMKPLFEELDKCDKVIFLTRVIYEYYSKFYPNVRLFDWSMITPINEPMGSVEYYDYDLTTIADRFDCDIHLNRIKAYIEGREWIKRF
jgi:hypothetical protein